MIRKSLGQHFFIGLKGLTLLSEEKKFIIENNVGGVVLFGRNIQSPEQVHTLCSEIASLRHQMPDKAPIFISIDQEGGRVARIKAPLTVWPPLSKLGDIDNPTVSFHVMHRIGTELKALGINLDFAPCIDVFTNPKNTVIGDRAISHEIDKVTKHASALVRGFIKADVVPCVKHFPGHGNTLIDSHEDLPIENVSLQELESTSLLPFKKAFKSRADLVMMAHILFPQIDPDYPATLSEIFIKKILKENCKYRGLITTDDLGMKALTKHHSTEDIATRALQVGVDFLLYCNDHDAPPVAMEALIHACEMRKINSDQVSANAQRIIAYKQIKIKNPDPLPFHEIRHLLGHADHQRLAAAVLAGNVPSELIAASEEG